MTTSSPAYSSTTPLFAAPAWWQALRQFLMLLSGADLQVLARRPSEQGRHVNLGLAVVGTAVLATVGMAFVMRVAFHTDPPAAIAVGLIWGLLIANLERLMISFLRRQKTRLLTVAMALPRILFAVLTGLVVSLPLMLVLFLSTIKAEIPVVAASKFTAFQLKLAHDPQLSQIPDLTNQVAALQKTVDAGVTVDIATDPSVTQLTRTVAAARVAYDKKAADVVCEIAGTCTDHHPGHGPVTDLKIPLRDQAAARLAHAEATLTAAQRAAQTRLTVAGQASVATAKIQLATLAPRLNALTDERDTRIAAERAGLADDNGLLIRVDALNHLTADNPALAAIHYAIAAVLIGLEVLPTLMVTLSLLGRPSPYETAQDVQEGVEAADDASAAEAEIKIAEAKHGQAIDQAQADRAQVKAQRDLERQAEIKIAEAKHGQAMDQAQADRAQVKAQRDLEHQRENEIHSQILEQLKQILIDRETTRVATDPDAYLI